MKITIIVKGLCILGFTIGSFSAAFSQQFSEEDIKINVSPISNSTEKIKNLKPVTFSYNRDKYKALDLPSGNAYGFLARDVKKVLPDMLQTSAKVYTSGKNSTKTAKYEEVDNEKLIPLLVAAIKEQQEEIEALKIELQKLKAD